MGIGRSDESSLVDKAAEVNVARLREAISSVALPARCRKNVILPALSKADALPIVARPRIGRTSEMSPHRYRTLTAAGLFAGSLAASCPAQAVPLQPDDALAKIGHIVVVFEENRSFDNMFGLFPGRGRAEQRRRRPRARSTPTGTSTRRCRR